MSPNLNKRFIEDKKFVWIHPRSWGLYRPPSMACSGIGWLVYPIELGTVPTTEHCMLGDWSTSLPNWARDWTDYWAWCARGLVKQSIYKSDDYTDYRLHMNPLCIQLRGVFNFLDLVTRLVFCLPSSSGTTSVRCIWWCISALDFLLSFFFSDPGTTCLRHLLPGSGTELAHFTLRWIYLLFADLVGTLHQKRNLFWLRAPCIIQTTNFFDDDVDWLSFELVKTQLQLFGRLSCCSKISSLTGRRSSYIIVHGAQGLAMGV